MDYVMPNMDGPTATAKMRSEGILSPVFGVTGARFVPRLRGGEGVRG